MNILHVDSSILGENSVSRGLTAAIVARQKTLHPGATVTYRDLADAPAAHLSPAHIAAWFGATPSDPAVIADLATGQAILDELFAADIIVIGAPMYNFTLPTQLKAWIDRILVPGKTFRYSAAGPEGLAGAKRVIVAVSRGGFYGDANAAAEHVESYLKTVFGFIGVTDLTFIAADGIQVGPEHREKAVKGALESAGQLRAA